MARPSAAAGLTGSDGPSPGNGASAPARGHAVGAHTADCIIEAWGPDRVSCFVEAMTALVEVFAAVGDAPVVRAVPVSVAPAPDGDTLVRLLEEVIYLVDVSGEVPVRFLLGRSQEGGVVGTMEVAAAGSVTLVGPVPKAVAYSQLQVAEDAGGWRCRAIVDV